MLITISMELSILYFKGSEFHIKCFSFIHEDCFCLSNLADPDKHFIWVYIVCQSTGHQNDKVSIICKWGIPLITDYINSAWCCSF